MTSSSQNQFSRYPARYGKPGQVTGRRIRRHAPGRRLAGRARMHQRSAPGWWSSRCAPACARWLR